MKILLCPDSFKGTLSSLEVADAMEFGVRNVVPDAEIVKVEIGDGGEGTVEALVRSLRSRGAEIERIDSRVCDPLGREIIAPYYIEGEKAYIEVASASGLTLIRPGERDVMRADTRGTGLQIADAYRRGCREFVIALGGSATCDGGKGIYDELKALHGRIWGEKPGVLMPDCRFRLLCDVRNPICGPTGAAAVFAPQKGATKEQVKLLEERLLQLSQEYCSIQNVDVRAARYAGAAGGIAGMFLSCCNADACDGIDYLLSAVDFPGQLKNCDLVITGEGCIDATTLHGKAISGILHAAASAGVPAAIVAGRVNLSPTDLSPNGLPNADISPTDSSHIDSSSLLGIEQATPSGLSLTDPHPWASFVTDATVRLLNFLKS